MNRFGITALAALLVSAHALADEPVLAPAGLQLGGRLFTDVYVPARDLDTSPYRQVSTSLWLQGDPKLGDHGYSRFILTTDVIESSGTSAGVARTGLREGFVGYAKNGYELRAGRQILPWGKSDVINPTDFLSAKDYTFFNPDEEVRRIGATSLWFNWTPSQGNAPWSLTAVATPVFPQTRLLIAPTVLPSNVTLTSPPIAPAATAANTEVALKGAYSGQGWDGSVSFFHGFNHIPEFVLLGVTNVGPVPGVTLGQTFRRIRALGADGSFTWSSWVFRGEGSYTWTENDSGANPLVQPSHLDTVVGAERALEGALRDFRVQAQLVWRYHPNYTDPAQAPSTSPVTAVVNPQLAAANALLLGYQFKGRAGATFRLGYVNEAEGVDAELFIVGNFVGGDYLIRPKLSYAWTDAVKSTVGMDYYGGPVDRPLGALQAFNSVFLEGKYSF